MPKDIHPLIFLAAFALPLVYFAVVWRRWPKVAIVSFALYLISYLPLTLSGTYTVANHGGRDWRHEWLPKYLVVDYVSLMSGRTRTYITLAGAFYWPCILIDRLVWHRTVAADV
jgi:hypothetical protein